MYNLFLVFSLIMTYSTQQSAVDLRLSVSGMDKLQGNLMIAVFDNGDDFPNEDKAIQRLVIPVKSKSQLINVPNLQPGKEYAIALYHDENANGKMDKNFFGVPTERYGFSNNARATFGPPSFEEAKFIPQNAKLIQITIK
jgi:uncharacterized protein (DUF2141 family)